MNLYKKIFPKKNSLLIVVHAESQEQVERNIKIAFEAGADGVFLVNHRIGFDLLLKIYEEIRDQYPNFWVGLNFLDLSASESLNIIPNNASGLWVDDAGVYEDRSDPIQIARMNWDTRSWNKDWIGLYFGGVAFKYQRKVSNLALAAKCAMPYMDVITTSGDATGHAPEIEKIMKIREAIGDFPLAIASGISESNVGDYLDLTNCFLVATSISDSFTELNPWKMDKLLKAMGR